MEYVSFIRNKNNKVVLPGMTFGEPETTTTTTTPGKTTNNKHGGVVDSSPEANASVSQASGAGSSPPLTPRNVTVPAMAQAEDEDEEERRNNSQTEGAGGGGKGRGSGGRKRGRTEAGGVAAALDLSSFAAGGRDRRSPVRWGWSFLPETLFFFCR